MADEPIKIDVPEGPDPLAQFKEALKWDSFAVGPPDQRNPKAALQMLLDELSERGADDTVLTRLRRMGPERVLSGKALPAEVLAKIPGGNSSLKQARKALRGVKGNQLRSSIEKTLSTLKETGEFDDRILDEIRQGVMKLGPEKFSKLPVQQVVSAMSQRGEGGRLAALYSRITKREPMGKVGSRAAAAAQAGAPIAKETRKALGSAGIRGAGAKMGKLGKLGTIAGPLFTAYQAYETFVAPEQRGQQRALLGTASSGQPVSSLEYLRARQQSDERLMERKAVLMQREPGLLGELARTAMSTRDSGPMTRSEMMIGSGTGAPSRAKPSPTTLLDQLLSELD